MRVFAGKAVFSGIAIGKIKVLAKDRPEVLREQAGSSQEELTRLKAAREKAAKQLAVLCRKTAREADQSAAMIFEVHQMMLEDQDYLDFMEEMIRSQGVKAEYAAASAGAHFAGIFAAMEDEYMKARAVDVTDISERLVRVLQGKDAVSVGGEEAAIIVAEDLTPSETVQLERDSVLAFVTRYGSAHSHTAVLAGTMNIPALIGVDYTETIDGKTAIVDGFEGRLIVEPEEAVLMQFEERRQQELHRRKLLLELVGKENITGSGKSISIFANIGKVSETAEVLQNDAGGIGLFRSEFLYLGRNSFPTEEEQFQAYRTVAERMGDKKVVIRTLDIGADKQADYFGLEEEENPAMGYRAIRICLQHPELLKTQLRAIFRAACFGNISVMYPMIISLDEIRKIKEIVREVLQELTDEKIPYAEVKQGIMIETPAAAVISDLLAKEVDFFSIGTNDLTQYTLAIDRQNVKLDNIYDSHHEAVLRLIRLVVDNAHQAGIWAGICGELGADITLTEEFIKMGVDELSVAPSLVLPVRKAVRDIR